MGRWFWIKRFLTVLLGAFLVIGVVQLLKGRDLAYSAFHGAVWSGITATVFTAARYLQARRGQHCKICRDTLEMQHVEPDCDA